METFIESIRFEAEPSEIPVMIAVIHELMRARGVAREKLMEFLSPYSYGDEKLTPAILYDFLNDKKDILEYLPASLWKELEAIAVKEGEELEEIAEEDVVRIDVFGKIISIKLAYVDEEEKKEAVAYIKKVLNALNIDEHKANVLLGKFIAFLRRSDYLNLEKIKEFVESEKINRYFI
ncbi:MAG: hypothetical protein QXL47_04180 [Candidatus Anstonellales archaeon]